MSVFHLTQPTFIGGAQPFAPLIRKIPPAATAFSASLSDTVSTRDALSSSPAGWTPRNLAALPGVQSIVGRWWAPPVIGQIAVAPTPPLPGVFALVDSVSSSDAFVAIAFGVSLADSASSSDGFTTSGHFTLSLSDTSATSDALSVTASARTTSDSIATSDSYLGAFLATASLADSLVTSDAYTAGTFAGTGTLSDTISVSDFFSTGGALSGALSDSFGTSDAYAGSFSAIGTLADTISASDLYSTGGVLTGSLSDSVGVADAYSGLMVSGGVIAESTATSDGYTSQPGLPLADTVSTTDIYSSVFSATVALLDTVIIGDGYTFPGNYVRTLSDTALASDTYQSFLDTPLFGPILYGRSYSRLVSPSYLAPNIGFNLSFVVPSQFWPDAQAGGAGFYIFDGTATITFDGGVDTVVGASISTRPSGTGELAPQSVTVLVKDGQTYIIARLSGGVASRNYVHQLVLTTQSGQTIPVLIGQVCDPVLAVPPIPPAPSAAFGTAVSWP